MRTISVIVIFLFCYTVGSASGHESSAAVVGVQCKRPGLHCIKDCKALEMCVFENGGSSSFIVEYCGEQNCHAPPGECNPQPLDSSCTFTFACQSEGQFPHPYDCTQYCTCNADLLHSCSFCTELGTAYNATSGTCDADIQQGICTDNPVPVCEVPAGIYPLEEDPSIYYVCLPDETGNLQPRFFKCLDGNEFNAETKQCSTFKCTKPGFFPDPKNCYFYYYCSPELLPQHYSCPKDEYYNSTIGRCIKGTCSSPGDPLRCTEDNIGIFPDVEDCTMYYVCNPDLILSHVKCPVNTHFNSVTDGCEVGPCDDSGTISPMPTCTSPGLFPDPDDCTKYYFCTEDGIPIYQTCSSGYFDPEQLKCVPGTCPTGTDPTTSQIPTTTPASFICSSPGLFPDPDDCTKYYFCMENLTPIHQTCSSGHFDPEKLKCVPGSCPTGTDPTTSQIPTTTPASFICSSTGLFPDPDDCTKYYFCMENLTPIHQTCSSGHFDPEELKCVPGSCPTGTNPTTTHIPTTTPASFICPSPGLFPDPDDCTKYYFCMENLTPIHQTCINGHFDSNVFKCVPGPCPPDFNCTEPGYFPNAQNCTTYFICFDDLTAKEESCPSGFHFDEFILICVEGSCEKSASKSTLLCTIMGFFTEPVHCSGYFI